MASSRRRRGVRVKRDAFFRRDLRNLLDRLDGADVVIDEVDADEGGLGVIAARRPRD